MCSDLFSCHIILCKFSAEITNLLINSKLYQLRLVISLLKLSLGVLNIINVLSCSFVFPLLIQHYDIDSGGPCLVVK